MKKKDYNKLCVSQDFFSSSEKRWMVMLRYLTTLDVFLSYMCAQNNDFCSFFPIFFPFLFIPFSLFFLLIFFFACLLACFPFYKKEKKKQIDRRKNRSKVKIIIRSWSSHCTFRISFALALLLLLILATLLPNKHTSRISIVFLPSVISSFQTDKMLTGICILSCLLLLLLLLPVVVQRNGMEKNNKNNNKIKTAKSS